MLYSNPYFARIFTTGAQLLELYEENPFKIRSYEKAADAIRALDRPLMQIPDNELETIEGIGPNLAKKIVQIKDSGTYDEFDRLIQQTPPGLLEMMRVKGLGAKKVRALWKDADITSLDQLMEVAESGGLAAVKGFGPKTVKTLLDNLHYYFENRSKVRLPSAEEDGAALLDFLRRHPTVKRVEISGELRRRTPVVSQLDLVVVSDADVAELLVKDGYAERDEEGTLQSMERSVPIRVWQTQEEELTATLFRTTAADAHLDVLNDSKIKGKTEEEIYENLGLPYIIPELREGRGELDWPKEAFEDLITYEGLKGCLHNHSTWSDGSRSIAEMAEACRTLGLEYFGIADHSKTAAYAGGLKENQVYAQWKEIDKLNDKIAPFRVFKGIESDILRDGSLDYPDKVLSGFDYVVASIHSGFDMTEAQATKRLLATIKNPHTTIMGHLTGRLLLSRAGYPVDHKTIIDACADYGVVIEINANPYRLDMDWHWLHYAQEKGVMLSINPDAHSIPEIEYMRYGVDMARKGGIHTKTILNAMGLEEIARFFSSRKRVIA